MRLDVAPTGELLVVEPTGSRTTTPIRPGARISTTARCLSFFARRPDVVLPTQLRTYVGEK